MNNRNLTPNAHSRAVWILVSMVVHYHEPERQLIYVHHNVTCFLTKWKCSLGVLRLFLMPVPLVIPPQPSKRPLFWLTRYSGFYRVARVGIVLKAGPSSQF